MNDIEMKSMRVFMTSFKTTSELPLYQRAHVSFKVRGGWGCLPLPLEALYEGHKCVYLQDLYS